MLKRIISGIVLASMLLSHAITGYAVLPQNMNRGSNTKVNKIAFHDDFTRGAGMWEVKNMTMAYGKMTSPYDTSSYIKFYDESLELTDAEYFIKFSPVSYNGGLAIVDIGTTPKYRVIIREKGLALAPVGMGEQQGISYPLENGKDYELKISEASGTANISVKQVDSDEYTSVGIVSGTDQTSGMITITGNKYSVDFKEVTVYDTSLKSVSFTENYRFMNVNEPTELEVINKTEKKIIFTSSDIEIAEVDENGVVTAKKSGKADITAATEDGKTSDICHISAYVPVTAIAINPQPDEMYVGQSEVVVGQFLPKDATNTMFEYVSSNPEIIRLNGGNNQYQSLTALAPGEATVTMISADGLTYDYKLTVLPKKEAEEREAVFSLSGFKREIPDRYFGVHHARLMNDYPMKTTELDAEYIERSEKIASKLIKDVGFGSVRSYWTWWDWQRAGRWNNDNTWSELPNRTTIEQIYDVTREGGAKHILTFSVFSTVDEMVEEFKEIKRVEPDYEIYIEYGNETYAINEQLRMPTVEVYIERLRELNRRIKEIDPTAKIGVPILEYRLERAIFNDPNNFPDGAENWEYTQGIRALTWNAALSENSDLFDAVIPHMYVSADRHRTNQQNYLKNVLKNMQGKARGSIRQAHQFPDKEYWVTEYGFFPQCLNIRAAGGKYMDLEQDGKDLGAAIVSATSALMLLDTPATVTSLHYLIDPQGFGIAQFADTERTKLDYLPHYYLYKELGKLFNSNSHYYGMNMEQGACELVAVNYNQETQYVDQQDVLAYGFGNADGVRKIAIVNTGENPTSISFEGMNIKPVMQYWSENPWPTLHTWPGKYTEMPAEVILPEYIENAEFSAEYTVKPFSFTVIEVSGGEEESLIAESVSQKLGEYAMFMTDSTKAYSNNTRCNIDLYKAGVTVRNIEEKKYLPMRALEKTSGQYVSYSDGEDGTVSYNIMEYRHLKEEKEIDADVSKVTSVETGLALIEAFYWNTKLTIDKQTGKLAKTPVIRDNERSISEIDEIVMLDGTTYITAELAAQILGYSINYYDGGLIVLSKNNVKLDEYEVQSIISEFER